MFRKPTTIIVGAGASCELGFPSGDELKLQIVKLLAPDDTKDLGFADLDLANAIRGHLGSQAYILSNELKAVMEAAKRIRRGLPMALSIDNFLHAHQQDTELVALGKAAIALCIARAERSSALFKGKKVAEQLGRRSSAPNLPTADTEAVAKSWYLPLAQHLMTGVAVGSLQTVFDNVRFVVFNYDRCLEQFLLMALQTYFDVDEHRAASVLENASFLHPYGSLGPLPWRASRSVTTLPYGSMDGADCWSMGGNLLTFTESVREKLGQLIREAVATADTILILGFGYLEQNVDLLTPLANRKAGTIISTAYQVEGDDQQMIRNIMRRFAHDGQHSLFVERGTCRDLFDHYRITLNFS